MKDVVVSKHCRIVDLAFLLTLITTSLVFICLLPSGCSKPKSEPLQAIQEISKSDPSQVIQEISEAESSQVLQEISETDPSQALQEISEESCGEFEQIGAGSRAVLEYKGVEFAFRYCPAGSFTMGSPASELGRDDDEEQRSVNISEGFWICETETTQTQWNAVRVKKGKECKFYGANLPVENVNWYESDAFVRKLNDLGTAPEGWRWALPTEEQWEYACRAGTTGTTCGKSIDECAWYYNTSEDKTHNVGMKKPNDWGIYDMLGNVWEWTGSKYNDGALFVNRGGAWMFSAQLCRPANRAYWYPFNVADYRGFRVILVRSQSE